MVNNFNKNIVNDTFNREYNEDQFKIFIHDLLPDADFTKEGQIQLPNEYREFIKSAKRICKYKYSTSEFDENVLTVLAVKLRKTTSVDRARTAQRNFVARYLNNSRNYLMDAALVAFYSEDSQGEISPDWRFSLVQMNYVTEIVEKSNGKKKRKTAVELTPAKRFSFLVGSSEDTHTAQSQFYHCLEKSSKGEQITLEDLVAAFDIEKVSKEFFEKYKELYGKLLNELTRLYDTDKDIKRDFDEHSIIKEDFAKKTMGQLVFLYFIQKKGWLGVPKDGIWGQGDKKFLRNVFEKDKRYISNYDNFFNDVLEHLFYEALAQKRENNDWFDRLNCRIPFLNGGLFEPVNGYEYEVTNLTIDNGIFKDIFDTFDLYNFTVKEDEPLEKEVAVDPEMLGKVFENLLPENTRKGNGAFYTPREIVHYMCQESLINYLYNKLNTKIVKLSSEKQAEQQSLFKKNKIKQMVLTEEIFEENFSREDISFLIRKGDSIYSNSNVKETMPDSIINSASIIDEALSTIKVCDPAIGSGAFPVGMMNEIVRVRATLSKYIGKPDRAVYDLKRNAIEKSIYGVDIDPGAVEIAKLRFWLSLVVDEENTANIKPLPNLDYKIMQGNSLITSYEGIDFDEIVANQPTEKQLDLFASKSEKITEKISQKQHEFLKTPYATKKREIKQEIEDLIIELVKTKFEEKAEKEGKSKDFYEEKIRNFAQNKGNRDFFPWQLFFADAFDNGGFDIVIGNPPYVQLQKFKGDPVQKLYKDAGFKVHDSNGDIYCLFYEKGIDILRKNGCLCYITSNKWMRAGYGEKLRTYFATKTNPIRLIDFGGVSVFETATVDVNILLVQKSQNLRNTMACTIESKMKRLNNLSVYISQNSIPQKFDSSSWCILNPIEQSIKNKIESIGTPLKDWDVNIYRGVLTGLNEAFIIDGAKKDELIAKDPKSAEIIRPILRGRDIQRYSYNFADKWLIATFPSRHYNIDEYPAIKEYLLSFDKRILEQSGEKNIDGIEGNNARKKTCNKWFETQDSIAYWDDFSKQKLVWAETIKIYFYGRRNYPRFCAVDENFYLDKTTFFMPLENNLYFLGILNSKLSEYLLDNGYCNLLGPGSRGLQKNLIEQFPMIQRNRNSKIIQQIELLLQKVWQTEIDNDTQIEIDELVFELYNITQTEKSYIYELMLKNT